MSADGVYDYDSDSLLLNNDTDNILLVDNNEMTEIAVLNELNIEVAA